MNIIGISNRKILITVMTLACLMLVSGRAFPSAAVNEDGPLSLNGDGIFDGIYQDKCGERPNFDECKLQMADLAAADTQDILTVTDKDTKYNKKLGELVEKYKAEHKADYLALLERSGLKKQKRPGIKGGISAMSGLITDPDGPGTDIGRPGTGGPMGMGKSQGPDMKGPGSDQRKGKKDTRVYKYIPPGEKVDVLFSAEQPNQPDELFSYAGSLIFGTVMRYQMEYIKKYASKYAYKNYGKQMDTIDRTKKMVSSTYQKPARSLEKMISRSVFSGGTDEVSLNFFYMRSIMGMRVNY